MTKKFLESVTLLAPFLQAYPAWVKAIIVAWVILSAIVLVCLVFVKSPRTEVNGLNHNIDSITVGNKPSDDKASKDKVAGDKVAGDKIEKQIVIANKSFDESVVIETFTIDIKNCKYKQYNYDPSKPLWPEDANQGVVYSGGKIKRIYGKDVSSDKEADEYVKWMEKTYNHYSYSKRTIHKIYFERLYETLKKNKANYPVFYISISNNKSKHIVLSRMEAIVMSVSPLVSIGESQALVPLQSYELGVSPSKGNYEEPMIPNLKIESGDAAAFEIILKPHAERVGGYSWLMHLRFYYTDSEYIQTDIFEIIM